MTAKNITPEAAAPAADTSREVVPAQAISINVEGGMIAGKFIKTMNRLSKQGEEYKGHIFQATGAICEDRQTKKPLPLVAGRYFVFGATRLDRLMAEVERGEAVKVTYLGKVANEVSEKNPKAEGFHNAFKVEYID